MKVSLKGAIALLAATAAFSPTPGHSQTKEPVKIGVVLSLSGPAAVIILAAGEGTRMKNHTPKVLNEVCGRTMLGHVVAAARELGPGRLIVVTGHGRSHVTGHLAEYAPEAEVVVQERQGGTGHAVRTVIETVGLIHGTVVVTYADTPLLLEADSGLLGQLLLPCQARCQPQ